MIVNDKYANDAHLYTDMQGLNQLRVEYKKNPDGVTKEIAQQFESLLVQMMMRSMREANKAFASELLGNNQMELYQDMFDKQLSLVMASNSGIGFAGAISKHIDPTHIYSDAAATTHSLEKHAPEATFVPNHPTVTDDKNKKEYEHPKHAMEDLHKYNPSANFDSQESFVKNLWPIAKIAAGIIGANPKILLAQAALETNWGKKILPYDHLTSSFNLFNIKADGNWTKKTTTVDSLEQRNGILSKEKSSFRSYTSFLESFMDYIHLLTQNNRYSDAVSKAADPKQFVHALQHAGYATDTSYADKVMKIFSSRPFQTLAHKME